MEDKQKFEHVRQKCLALKKDTKESLNILAQRISTGDHIINPNALSMALTGYRGSKSSVVILEKLLDYLMQTEH
jgi:hypothetical protein